MPRKTRKRTQKRKRLFRGGGGDIGMKFEQVEDNEKIGINPKFVYYLKLGEFQDFNEDNDMLIFKQNGQLNQANKTNSIIFKTTNHEHLDNMNYDYG